MAFPKEPPGRSSHPGRRVPRLHETQLQNVQHHEIVVLHGGHYLHWAQSKVMAEKINAFLGQYAGRP